MSAASSAPSLLVSLCRSCHLRFAPRLGRCPKCGSVDLRPHSIGPEGTALAATELAVPPAGFSVPHRLALVEAAEGVRLLCIVEGGPVALGDHVRVRRDDDRYFAQQA